MLELFYYYVVWTDFSAMFLFCQKAQELEEMDNVFGVGDLIEESTKSEMKNFYSSKHLKGLEVQHSMVYNIKLLYFMFI